MPFQFTADMADSIDVIGREMARAREIRALRREVPKVAARRPVTRSLHGPSTTYQLEIRPGIKVQAAVQGSGRVLASFTRETSAGKNDVLDLHQRAARKMLRDLRSRYVSNRRASRIPISDIGTPSPTATLTQPTLS